MGLLDLIKSAKDAVWQVATDIKNGTFTENWQAAWQQAGQEAYDAMSQGKDRGIVWNLQGTVLDLASGGENVQKQIDTYKQSGDRNIVADALWAVAQAPATISAWLKGTFDSSKTGLERVDAATKAGLGFVWLLPGAAGWNLAYETMVPTEAKKTVQDAVLGLQWDVSTFGQTLGMSKADSDATASILQNALGIAAGIIGPKIGKSVENTASNVTRQAAIASWVVGRQGVRSLSSMVGKTAGLTANAIVQASPELIPLAWDFYKEHKDKADGGWQAALISLATQMAGVLPIKGLKKRIKSDIAAEQTKMNLDSDKIMETGYWDDPQKWLTAFEKRRDELIASWKALSKDGLSYTTTKEWKELFNINGAIEQAKLDLAAKVNKTPLVVDKLPADVNKPEKVAVEPTTVAKVEPVSDIDVTQKIEPTPSLTEKVKKTKQKKVSADTVPVAPIEPAPMEAPVTPLTMKEDATVAPIPEAPVKSTFDKFMETNPTIEKVQEANKVTELLQNGGDIDAIKKNTILTPEEVDMLNPNNTENTPSDTPNLNDALQNAIDTARISPDNFSLGSTKLTNMVRNATGRVGSMISNRLSGDMIHAMVNGTKMFGSQIVEAIRDPMRGRIIDNLTSHFDLDTEWAPLKDVKVEITPQMLEGKVIPGFYGDNPLSPWAAQKAVETFKNTSFFDRSVSKSFTRDQIANIGKASWVYKLFANDPATLEKMFTPDQIAVLKKDAEINSTRQIETSGILTSDEFNKANGMKGNDRYLAPGIMVHDTYERTSISPENFNRFMKDFNIDNNKQITVADENGRMHTFKSALDFYTAYQSWLKDGTRFNEDAFVSFLKSKDEAPVLDLYRDQGSIVSMNSYINNVAQLVANRETLKSLDNAIANTKDTASASYAKKMLLSDDFLMASIDVPQSVGKFAQAWHKYVTPLTSATRLFLSPTTYVQAAYSSSVLNITDALLSMRQAIKSEGIVKWTIRTLSETAKAVKNTAKSVALMDMPESKDPFIMNTLAENGFSSSPEHIYDSMYEGAMRGKVIDKVKEVAQISAGAKIENNTKVSMALRNMDGFLRSKDINSANPTEVAKNWTDYQAKIFADPKSIEYGEFIKARADIKMMNATIGDFSKMARLSTPIIGEFTRDMKTWQVGQVSAMIRDLSNMNDPAAAKRIGVQFAPYALAVYGLYKAYDDEGDEDALEHAIAGASSLAFSPAGLFQLVEGVTSSSSIGFVTSALNTGINAGLAALEGEGTIAKTELMKLTDLLGAKKGMRAMYSAWNMMTPDDKFKTFDQALSDLAGTENYKDVTKYGYAKERAPNTAGEALWNIFIPEEFITETLDRGYVKRLMEDTTYTNQGAPSMMNVLRKIFTGTENPLEEIQRKWSQDWLTSMADREQNFEMRKKGLALKSTMDILEKNTKLSDAVAQLGLNPEAEENILASIIALQENIESTNQDTKDAINQNSVIFYAKNDPKTNLPAYLEEMKTGNPYAYNRIISGFNNASLAAAKAPAWSGTWAPTYEYRSQKDIIDSTFTSNDNGQQYYDFIIADRNNTKALTTSFMNDTAKKFNDATEIPAVDRVSMLERFAKEIVSKSYNKDLTDSFAENVAKIFSLVDGNIVAFWQAIGKEYIEGKIPNLLKYIQQGLVIRGEQPISTNPTALWADGSQTSVPPVIAPWVATPEWSWAMKAAKISSPKWSSWVSDNQKERKIRTLSEIIGDTNQVEPLAIRKR